MSNRRRGDINAYWGTLDSTGLIPTAAAVLASGYSKAAYIGQEYLNFGIIVNVSAATTVSLLVAHSSQLDSSGNSMNTQTAPATNLFAQVYWNGTAIQVAFASAGAAYIIVPDFVAGWTMLQSSGAANIWAGYEAV